MKLKIPFPSLYLTAALSLAMLCGCSSSSHAPESSQPASSETPQPAASESQVKRPPLNEESSNLYTQVSDGTTGISSSRLTSYDYTSCTGIQSTTSYPDPSDPTTSNYAQEDFSFETNASGKITRKEYSSGIVEEYTYSDNGGYGGLDLSHVRITDSNRSDYLIELTYNEFGLLTHGVWHIYESDDNAGHVECIYEYEYLKYDYTDSPLYPTYVSRTDSNGEISYVELEYNALGNCISMTDINEAGEETAKVEFVYDVYGKCINELYYSPGTDGLYMSEKITRDYGYD